MGDTTGFDDVQPDHWAAPFIKQLVARGPKFIVCRQFNPHGEVRFATDRVRSLYRIIPTNELFGAYASGFTGASFGGA